MINESSIDFLFTNFEENMLPYINIIIVCVCMMNEWTDVHEQKKKTMSIVVAISTIIGCHSY